MWCHNGQDHRARNRMATQAKLTSPSWGRGSQSLRGNSSPQVVAYWSWFSKGQHFFFVLLFVYIYKDIAWERGSILRWIADFDREPVSPSDRTIVWLWDNFEAFLSKLSELSIIWANISRITLIISLRVVHWNVELVLTTVTLLCHVIALYHVTCVSQSCAWNSMCNNNRQMAISLTLRGFNDLGRSVTSIFLWMGRFLCRFSTFYEKMKTIYWVEF